MCTPPLRERAGARRAPHKSPRPAPGALEHGEHLTAEDAAALVGVRTDEVCPFYDFEEPDGPLPPLTRAMVLLFAVPVVIYLTLTFAGLFIYMFYLYGLTLLPQGPRRRRLLHASTLAISRFFLHATGWRLEYEGKENLVAARESGVPFLCVANHTTIFDAFGIAACMGPFSPVAFSGTKNYPAIGRIATEWGALFVDRRDKGKGFTKLLGEHARRQTAPELGARDVLVPMLVFPEATTTSGRSLGRFKKGAFVPGLAVAPIVMRFRCPGVSPGWVGPHSFGVHLVRMFMQWKLKTITTTCLPLYRPSDAEKADPELYSRNVQRYMADALGVPACQDWGIEESRALYSVLDENYAKSS